MGFPNLGLAVFQTPPEAHHQPPEPPEQSQTKERCMFALHFASEVLRVSYMFVLLVCLLTVFGFDRAAGFITALFGGPS